MTDPHCRGGGNLVLVVDDDPLHAKLSKIQLEVSGFRVSTAASPDAAMTIARSQRPSAVLCDVVMPEMDGFAVCRALRSYPETAAIPVLLFTSHTVEAADRARGASVGASDILMRTGDHEDLIRALLSALQSPPPPPQMRPVMAGPPSDRRAGPGGAGARVGELSEPEPDLRGQEPQVAAPGSINRAAGTSDLDRAFASLALSEQRFRAISEHAPIGILILDLEQRIVHANPAIQEMCGCSAAQLCSMTLGDLISPESAAAEQALFRELVDGTRHGYRLESRYRHRAGGTFWTNTVSLAVRGSAGQFLYSVAMVQDITDQKMIEAATQEVNARLRRLDEVKNEFLAIVSHDLRSPVNTIMAAVEVLRDLLATSAAPDADRLLRILEQSAAHLGELVRNLLDIAVIERGELNLKVQPTDLAALAADVVRESGALAAKAGVSVELASTSPSVVIPVDSGRLIQLLTNLVTNALRHARTTVQVAVKREQDICRVEVEDDGAGVEPELLGAELDRLALLQAHHGASRRRGFGLAIVRGIADAHGGRAWVENRSPGPEGDSVAGARFVVELPALGTAHDEKTDAVWRFSLGRRRLRILLAQGNAVLRSQVRRELEGAGFAVEEAITGQEALACARSGDFKLLLLDLGMPGLDGFAVLERLRAAGDRLPVILMASERSEEDRRRALELGAFASQVSAPMDLPRLLDTVRTALEPV
ncbi:MAG: response regulator [Candidatus Schekmanbacteria bacterium]|nr:response regulator [Candidatus Schekmanbacteria bacterium]